MKKTIKSLLLAAIMCITLLILTGCGGNKLVATRSNDDNGIGKYEEKIEVSFKNDKANEIVWTMEFEEEDDAKTLAEVFQEYNSDMEGLEVEQKGKKVTLTMSSDAFAEQKDLDDESMTKEEIKKSLEEAGYEVK